MQDPSKYTKSTSFDLWAIIKDNTNLQILILAILVGFILNFLQKKETYIHWLGQITHYVFVALKWVMYLAPLGALGGMSYAIGKYGLHTLIPLGKLMGTMYITMALFIFVILGGILKYYQLSIWDLIKHIKEELLIVLGTSSSESVLPRMMEKLENLGARKSVVGLVIPTGYSFNLDGTSIYLTMAAVFIAQATDTPMSLTQQLTLLAVLLLTSKGAAGITGSGYQFSWTLWPTTVRYEATMEDGGNFPTTTTELYNKVLVRWYDRRGRSRSTTRTGTCPILDAAGITRQAVVDVSNELGSLSNAQRIGDNFLAAHKYPPNGGVLNVARPIRDLYTGRMVDPFEIEPAELIRVRGVESYPDALNASSNDGQTVFRIWAMQYADSTNTSNLELDTYPRDTAQALARLQRMRNRKR